jgi:hypothetical protein
VTGHTDTRDRLEVEVRSEPVLAWRAWSLSGRRDGSGLLLRPVARRARTWRPREVVEASCRTSRLHEAPDPACTCGLHGTHDLETLRWTKSPAVVGRVALWGRVIEHEHGFRARYAYPQRLRLLCQFCFWRSGARAEPPLHVGWFPRDELIPACEHHLEVARRCGVAPRVVLSADEIGHRLLDTYAVDALVI